MGFSKTSLPTNIASPLSSSPSSYQRFVMFSLLMLFFFPLLLFTIIFPDLQIMDVICFQTQTPALFSPLSNKVKVPKWLEVIQGPHGQLPQFQNALKLGIVNFHDTTRFQQNLLHGITYSVTIDFDLVSSNITWKKLFPEWVDEGKSFDMCPHLPMPESGKYPSLDVVVVKLPCDDDDNNNNRNTTSGKLNKMEEGIRNVQRLQVSLAAGRLVVDQNGVGGSGKYMYVVFVGKCEPMVEIFKCDDLVWHDGEYWVYKPNVHRLREVISMPVGTCGLAPPYLPAPGSKQLQANPNMLKQSNNNNHQKPREAYVTVLHSSELYVCGAIALAQSIRLTNITKDLVLLADHSISNHSIAGLQAAGWKIKRIARIRSPSAQSGDYNEWNYSKLRVWELTEYDKVMFIDSDFIVLRNIDLFFRCPQLSARPNHKWLFNSGIMILEPSQCFFDNLMSKRYSINSYNGGDQGYLNEIFTWWHRLSAKLSFMKFFMKEGGDRVVPEDLYTIHFFGWKPWICYRDYDCNWDRKGHQVFASDDAHARWWQVYDSIPAELQPYCSMTKEHDSMLRKRRESAQKANLSDGHWKIEIKDPRQFHLVNINSAC